MIKQSLFMTNRAVTSSGITVRGVGTWVGSSSTLIISSPAAATTGDVLLCFVLDRATAGVPTAPSPGWTYVGGTVYGGGSRFATYTATVGSNGLTGTSWAFPKTSAGWGGMVAYSGVNSTTLDCAVAARYNSSAGTTGAPGITSVNNNAMIVYANGNAGASNVITYSAETMATNPSLSNDYRGSYPTTMSMTVNHGILAVAGPTGDSSATQSLWKINHAILIALRPA